MKHKPLHSIRISEEAGVRYLQFGPHWIQGAMRVSRPWMLELEYTREMMFPLLLRRRSGWPASVLQIGLGAGSITKFLYRHMPRTKMTVVEIAPEVVMTAWQFFRLPPESRRLRIELGDGYDYMADTHRRFDLIMVDGFDSKARAGALDSAPFYSNCRLRLARGGMLVTNLVGRRADTLSGFVRVREAFGGRVQTLPPRDANRTVLATVCPAVSVDFASLRARALSLKALTGLDLLPVVSRLIDARAGYGRLEI